LTSVYFTPPGQIAGGVHDTNGKVIKGRLRLIKLSTIDDHLGLREPTRPCGQRILTPVRGVLTSFYDVLPSSIYRRFGC
jgi:hypothetical protein